MLNNDASPINGIGAWLYTTRKALVFILYMGLSVLYGLLVHASRRPGSRPFSPVVTVLTAELLKLIVNASIFLYMERFGSLAACHVRIRNCLTAIESSMQQTADRGTCYSLRRRFAWPGCASLRSMPYRRCCTSGSKPPATLRDT